ncbi:MAG: universal stress protein [Verrucomicrobia bacterium]|jgi:nucleotide-binding universal stress UspA family protein|nr:universal stress protein [Verrucomicrobiota bacterium]
MKSPFFHKILHPTDFSLGDEGAFAHALRMGLAGESDISLLHVARDRDDVHWSEFPHVRDLLTQWEFIPENATKEMVEATGMIIKKSLRSGRNPVKEIANYLEAHPCDLVVLATHQRNGLASWLQHSRSEAIARKSETMTLFVPRQVRGFVSSETGCIQLNNILVPVAHQPSAHRAAKAAEAIASLFSVTEVRIEFLHIGSQSDAPNVRIPCHSGWVVEHSAWEGNVVEHILSTSETQNTDLIVMATEGHHGFIDALRGSTTEQVLKQTKCPLLAVPTF